MIAANDLIGTRVKVQAVFNDPTSAVKWQVEHAQVLVCATTVVDPHQMHQQGKGMLAGLSLGHRFWILTLDVNTKSTMDFCGCRAASAAVPYTAFRWAECTL